MKLKKLLPLIILVVILGALIGAYMVALNMAEDEEKTEDTADTATVVLSTHKESDISSITYTVEDGEVTLERSDEGWVIPNDEKFPVDTTVADNMAGNAVALMAYRTVEGEDMSAFGLDKPSLTVGVKYSDGEEDRFELGDENSFSGQTYLLFNGTVYMVEDTLTKAFDFTKDELVLIDDSFPAITAESITSVELTGENGESNTFSDTEGIEKFYGTAKSALAFKNYKGYGLDAEGLAEYGITGEGASLKIKYKTSSDSSSSSAQLDAVFTVCFGRDEVGNVFYAAPEGSMTYAMNAEEFNALMDYLDYKAPETTE